MRKLFVFLFLLIPTILFGEIVLPDDVLTALQDQYSYSNLTFTEKNEVLGLAAMDRELYGDYRSAAVLYSLLSSRIDNPNALKWSIRSALMYYSLGELEEVRLALKSIYYKTQDLRPFITAIYIDALISQDQENGERSLSLFSLMQEQIDPQLLSPVYYSIMYYTAKKLGVQDFIQEAEDSLNNRFPGSPEALILTGSVSVLPSPWTLINIFD